MAKTLLDSLSEYECHVGAGVASNTRSLIKKHVLPDLLPSLGFGKSTQKLTPVLEKLPVAGFIEQASPILQSKLLEIENSGTRKVIKCQWKRFCTWLQEQDWYCSEPMTPETPGDASPQYTHFKLIPVPKGKGKTPVLGIKESDLTPHLQQQFQEFRLFKNEIRPVTVKSYCTSIKQFLKWQRDVEGISAQSLNITEMTDLTILEEYRKWLKERGLCFNSVKSYLRVAPAIQAWILNQKIQDVTFRNSEIEKIWTFVNATKDDGKRPRVSEKACKERELTVNQCNEILLYLRWRCKDLEEQQGLTSEVVDAWMDYLIIAVLITTGVRQREVRELCVSRLRLFKGLYSVMLTPEEHKTGSKSTKGRGYPLFVGPLRRELCEDLAYYIDHIRPNNLEHDCLFFTRQNTTYHGESLLRGRPIPTSGHLSGLVPKLFYRVTAHLFGEAAAKATQCHDFRRITATWVCTYGEPKHFRLYAEMLGMSEEVLRKIYAKLHPGALAAQVPFAHEEIAANELKMAEEGLAGETRNHKQGSLANLGSTQNEQELLRMLKMMWIYLPKAKREGYSETLSPFQRQVLEVSRTAY